MIKFLIKALSIIGITIGGSLLIQGTVYDRILTGLTNILTGRFWLFAIITFFTVFGVGAFVRWLFRLIVGNMEENRYKRSLKRK
ncbi:hypothetical protein IJD15_00555 [bacterium]|nr:hypothetical protein [bacterium]